MNKQILGAGISRKRQRGITIVEYAVAGSVLVAVGAAAFFALGSAVSDEILRLVGFLT